MAPARLPAQEPPARDSGNVPVVTDLWRALRDPARATWARPLASAVIPGTGQLLGGRERGALYLVVEAFLLTRSLALSAEGRRERDRYRELALVVARSQFTPTDRDTVFEYFEQMGRYVESGPFDTDPGPALVPPVDERTYNGQIWALARRTYFADPDLPPPTDAPEFQSALAFYSSRAIGPNYQWSWRNAGVEQDLYRQTIRESDEAFRQASQGLGLILANHLLSTVDAAITERLARRGNGPRVQTGLSQQSSWDPRLTFTASISIAFD
jgi:hypothetical protein